MKTKHIILFALLAYLWPMAVRASHIVGGEIQFYPKDATKGLYHLGLNLYFDVANGRTQAEDQNITLYIFSTPTIVTIKTEADGSWNYRFDKELEDGELFVNLASNEYFSVIDVKELKVPVITPEFKDYKNGQLKIISFFAKKARGLMVRYIIDTGAKTIEDLKGFDYEGYQFDANLSEGTHLVFTR